MTLSVNRASGGVDYGDEKDADRSLTTKLFVFDSDKHIPRHMNQ